MKILQVKETCIYVHDLEQTQNFYSGILGLAVIARKEGRHIFFNAGTSVLLCFIPEASARETELPPHWASGPAHLAFEVSRPEYENWKQAITSKGVEIIHEQEWGDDFNSFYFHDPDGHVLEIVPEGMWEYLGGV
jgi:catechol 2,3-dioxygenase-like lactoylglutathione lyase family enzyme